MASTPQAPATAPASAAPASAAPLGKKTARSAPLPAAAVAAGAEPASSTTDEHELPTSAAHCIVRKEGLDSGTTRKLNMLTIEARNANNERQRQGGDVRLATGKRARAALCAAPRIWD